MANDGSPVQIPATSLVHGSQAPTAAKIQQSGGNSLPQGGNIAAGRVANSGAATTSLQAQVALLNKFLNDSGRPAQFRVDPSSDDKLIQEINPATSEVIAEYSAAEFPALARSVGLVGSLVDSRA
jgi:hypothetical protein